MKLENQVAVITGAGAGIGRAAATLFAENGAKVVAVDWNEEQAGETVKAIEAAGGQAVAVKADVSKAEEAQQAMNEAKTRFGRLDVLINNAGITRDSSLLKMEPHQWDQVIGVNLSGTFHCAKAAAQIMREGNYGRIISTSSVSAFGNFGQTNYAATKAGIVGMTRTMALELAKYKITVNAVAPGYIETQMTAAVPQDIREQWIERIPVKRSGKPLDIARVYLFLALPDSDFINGALFVIDGGQTIPY